MLVARPQLLSVALFVLSTAQLFSAANDPIHFNRDIRPILAENCFACHGPDKNQRKAKLRLDVREVALELEAIVPGKPDQSKLVAHVFSTDPDDLMPPPKSNKKLTQKQKELLKNWIAAGAPYEPHWAYIPPQRSSVPKSSNGGWAKNPIDAFILQRLKRVRPSPEADKRTLLRRLSLDLIGLPPTPAELQAFLADNKPDAYERQVERLLNSPHFGERMAVPWLDIVRFSDTVGYHGDQNEYIFPYRDYVINAFNSNKPFDQFTIEQIAGDLLPDPSIDAYVASGFNRLNMMTREGGAQPKEYLAKYAADRVRTVSMAWMGSTMGCAECHDHKYDPFTTKDFYQMEAFFADIKQWGVYQDYTYTPNPDLKGWSNDHPFPPEIEVDSPYLQRRKANLEARGEELITQTALKVQADKQLQPPFEQWRKSSRAFLKQWPTGWALVAPEINLRLKDTNAVAQANFTLGPDATIRFSDQAKESLRLTLPLSNSWLAAIRLEIVPHETQDQKKMSRKRAGTAVSLGATLKRADAKDKKLAFYFAEANHKQQRYYNGETIIGVKDVWQISTDHGEQQAVWLLEKPFQAQAGDSLVIDLGNLNVSSARVSLSPFASSDPLQAGPGPQLSACLKLKRPGKKEARLLHSTYLLSTDWNPELVAQSRKIEDEIRQCRNGRAFTMVTASQEPIVTRVLPRGNWQDESGEIVQPLPPHFLPPVPNPDSRRLTRLDLAYWLVSTNNPLTARAVMNRLWKQFFGTGISAVIDDLGAQGEWPVHPELLDWLACEFMQPTENIVSGGPAHAWDLKHMVRLLVTSATYRQNSNQRPDLKETDPNNRLLACQSPRRLEAEFVRDNALAIGGLLFPELGGPSFHPYQPGGYYVNLQFPDRDYYPEMDERQYRRGVYAHWQRTFLQPMLANFDAPSREECTAMRVVSNTPQQALTLLNDPTFVEASRAFALRLLGDESAADTARINLAFELALGRPVKPAEQKSLLEFLATQRAHYRADEAEAGKLLKIGIAPNSKDRPAAEVAAWTQLCRVILNLQETITVY